MLGMLLNFVFRFSLFGLPCSNFFHDSKVAINHSGVVKESFSITIKKPSQMKFNSIMRKETLKTMKTYNFLVILFHFYGIKTTRKKKLLKIE
jgi:hypothetical protein